MHLILFEHNITGFWEECSIHAIDVFVQRIAIREHSDQVQGLVWQPSKFLKSKSVISLRQWVYANRQIWSLKFIAGILSDQVCDWWNDPENPETQYRIPFWMVAIWNHAHSVIWSGKVWAYWISLSSTETAAHHGNIITSSSRWSGRNFCVLTVWICDESGIHAAVCNPDRHVWEFARKSGHFESRQNTAKP